MLMDYERVIYLYNPIFITILWAMWDAVGFKTYSSAMNTLGNRNSENAPVICQLVQFFKPGGFH